MKIKLLIIVLIILIFPWTAGAAIDDPEGCCVVWESAGQVNGCVRDIEQDQCSVYTEKFRVETVTWNAEDPACASYPQCYTEVGPIKVSTYLPGLASFTDCPHPPCRGYTVTGGIASYIKIVYTFLVSITGILAAVMIMWGGFKWLTAAGNPGLIGSAKNTILGAIIGLVLALGSYTLLYFINPNLVEFKQLKLIKTPRLVLATVCDSVKECPHYEGLDEEGLQSLGFKHPREICEKDPCKVGGRRGCKMLNNHCSNLAENLASGQPCFDADEACASGVCLNAVVGSNPNRINDYFCSDATVGALCNGSLGSGPGIENPTCKSGLYCVTTGEFYRCTDGQIGSPCSTVDNCEIPNPICNQETYTCEEEEGWRERF